MAVQSCPGPLAPAHHHHLYATACLASHSPPPPPPPPIPAAVACAGPASPAEMVSAASASIPADAAWPRAAPAAAAEAEVPPVAATAAAAVTAATAATVSASAAALPVLSCSSHPAAPTQGHVGLVGEEGCLTHGSNPVAYYQQQQQQQQQQIQQQWQQYQQQQQQQQQQHQQEQQHQQQQWQQQLQLRLQELQVSSGAAISCQMKAETAPHRCSPGPPCQLLPPPSLHAAHLVDRQLPRLVLQPLDKRQEDSFQQQRQQQLQQQQQQQRQQERSNECFAGVAFQGSSSAAFEVSSAETDGLPPISPNLSSSSTGKSCSSGSRSNSSGSSSFALSTPSEKASGHPHRTLLLNHLLGQNEVQQLLHVLGQQQQGPHLEQQQQLLLQHQQLQQQHQQLQQQQQLLLPSHPGDSMQHQLPQLSQAPQLKTLQEHQQQQQEQQQQQLKLPLLQQHQQLQEQVQQQHQEQHHHHHHYHHHHHHRNNLKVEIPASPPATPSGPITPGTCASQAVPSLSPVSAAGASHTPGILDDGFAWRKYGQKPAKGAHYPRHYYRCAVWDCPARKTVEVAEDGESTEVVYREEHNHPPPAPQLRIGVGVGRDGSALGGAKEEADVVVTVTEDLVGAMEMGEGWGAEKGCDRPGAPAAVAAAASAGLLLGGAGMAGLNLRCGQTRGGLGVGDGWHGKAMVAGREFGAEGRGPGGRNSAHAARQTAEQLLAQIQMERDATLRSLPCDHQQHQQQQQQQQLETGSWRPGSFPGSSALSIPRSGCEDGAVCVSPLLSGKRLREESSPLCSSLDNKRTKSLPIDAAFEPLGLEPALSDLAVVRHGVTGPDGIVREGLPSGLSVQCDGIHAVSGSGCGDGSDYGVAADHMDKRALECGGGGGGGGLLELLGDSSAVAAGATASTKTPKVMIRVRTARDDVDDGYKWRKYGEKVIKNSPFKRSYFRCSRDGCGVKRVVERMKQDPGCLIATYEGEHCHSQPIIARVRHCKGHVRVHRPIGTPRPVAAVSPLSPLRQRQQQLLPQPPQQRLQQPLQQQDVFMPLQQIDCLPVAAATSAAAAAPSPCAAQSAAGFFPSPLAPMPASGSTSATAVPQASLGGPAHGHAHASQYLQQQSAAFQPLGTGGVASGAAATLAGASAATAAAATASGPPAGVVTAVAGTAGGPEMEDPEVAFLKEMETKMDEYLPPLM